MTRALPMLLFFGLAAGCGDGDGDDAADADSEADSDADTDADSDGDGFHLGTFSLDTYSIPFQGDFEGEDVVLVSCSGGEPIATVPSEFAAAVDAQGSGKLLDGRVVVPGGGAGCYEALGPEAPWGVGSRERPLEIFRSIAAHPGDVEEDRWLWIPQMDGLTMPGEGSPHDGCVRFDDDRDDVETGWFSLFAGLAENEGAVQGAVGGEVDAWQDSPNCFGWEE